LSKIKDSEWSCTLVTDLEGGKEGFYKVVNYV